MPPSGFSQKAVDGAVQFARTCFEDLLTETRLGKHEDFKSAVLFEIAQIGPHTHTVVKDRFAIAGGLQFISSCYTDLLSMLNFIPDAPPEDAIESTVAEIRRSLEALHIDHRGRLLERRPSDSPESIEMRVDSFEGQA